LADAQWQRGGFDVGDVCQVKLRQGITNRRLAARAEAVEAGVQGEVLPHGEFFVERECLRHVADAHPRRHAARIDRRAEQLRRAAGRPSIGDTRSVTRGEVLALKLAEKAGIPAAPARIVLLGETPIAVIRRFDRGADDTRIPYQSAATLLQTSQASPYWSLAWQLGHSPLM